MTEIYSAVSTLASWMTLSHSSLEQVCIATKTDLTAPGTNNSVAFVVPIMKILPIGASKSINFISVSPDSNPTI